MLETRLRERARSDENSLRRSFESQRKIRLIYKLCTSVGSLENFDNLEGFATLGASECLKFLKISFSSIYFQLFGISSGNLYQRALYLQNIVKLVKIIEISKTLKTREARDHCDSKYRRSRKTLARV